MVSDYVLCPLLKTYNGLKRRQTKRDGRYNNLIDDPSVSSSDDTILVPILLGSIGYSSQFSKFLLSRVIVLPEGSYIITSHLLQLPGEILPPLGIHKLLQLHKFQAPAVLLDVLEAHLERRMPQSVQKSIK